MANEFIARNGVIALANSTISGSLSVTNSISGSIFTGSFVGGLTGTSSYASTALSASYSSTASFATTASYAALAGTASYFSGSISNATNATSASYAATASYALNAGAGGGSTTVLGGTATLTQSLAATTWSFAHNLGLTYPVVTVYDGTSVIQPQNITPTDANNLKIYFSSPKSGYAVAVAGGGYYVTNAGTTRVLTVTTASATWSFQHNIGDQYPAFTIFDSSNNVLIPSNIQAVDINTATITFAYPTTGKAVATLGGGSGYGTVITTTSASSTWSLTHNLRENYPIVTIWESGSNQIIQPDTITSVDQNTVLVTFTSPVQGYANISRAGSIISGSFDWNLIINKPNVGVVYSQSLALSTWNIAHNLGTQFPLVTVYDSSNAVILPQSIVGNDANNITITFPSPQSGTVNLSKAGNYISGSVLWSNITSGPFSTTGSVTKFTGSLAITGSLISSGSLTSIGTNIMSGSFTVYTSGSSVEFQVLGTGTQVGNAYTDTHTITGSLGVSGSTSYFGATHQFTGSLIVSGALFVSASGNIGVGVTPSTWDSSWKAIELFNQGNFIGSEGGKATWLGSNNIYSGSAYRYINNNGAAQYILQSDGSHKWRVTSPGTVGSIITWTDALFLSSSGNLGVGTSNPIDIIDVQKNQNATTNFYFRNTDSTNTNSRAYLNVVAGTNSVSIKSISGDNSYLSTKSGNLYFQTQDGAVNPMIITSVGNVGILGTPISSTGQLQVFGNDGIRIVNSGAEYRQLYHYAGGTLYFYNGTNQAYLTSGGVWTNASDISIKKDIKDIEYGLNEVLRLKPRWYKMKEDDIEQIGFIAQEVEEVIKEVVMTDHFGMKGLSYGNLTSVLVKAIQELTVRVQELENK